MCAMFIILVAFASVKMAFDSVPLALFSRASGLIGTEYTPIFQSLSVAHVFPFFLQGEQLVAVIVANRRFGIPRRRTLRHRVAPCSAHMRPTTAASDIFNSVIRGVAVGYKMSAKAAQKPFGAFSGSVRLILKDAYRLS